MMIKRNNTFLIHRKYTLDFLKEIGKFGLENFETRHIENAKLDIGGESMGKLINFKDQLVS